MLQDKNNLTDKEKEQVIKNKKTDVKKEEQTLLTFLAKTKKGKYAKIEESSLPYARLKEEREDIKTYEEEYYFSIS